MASSVQLGVHRNKRCPRTRNMQKLCIFNPEKFGLNFFELREMCRPLGQLLHFQWDSRRQNVFAIYNTEEYL